MLNEARRRESLAGPDASTDIPHYFACSGRIRRQGWSRPVPFTVCAELGPLAANHLSARNVQCSLATLVYGQDMVQRVQDTQESDLFPEFR